LKFLINFRSISSICWISERIGKIQHRRTFRKLQLGTNAEVEFSIKNLPSLRRFSLSTFSCRIDEKIVTRLLYQAPNIQELHFNGKLCYFNLDSLVNLRVLSLNGFINENFNFKLFKNLCNQLESIKISSNIDEKTLFKLFDGYNFPYLRDFTLMCFSTNRLTKEFIDQLPKPRQLNITECNVKVIEHDSFTNMQQLTSLNLTRNQIELIEENAFSNLNNLETVDLSFNRLKNFDRNFIGLGNLETAEVNIERNDFNSLFDF
jgi:Leucine-rich repeat (LRR) protein